MDTCLVFTVAVPAEPVMKICMNGGRENFGNSEFQKL